MEGVLALVRLYQQFKFALNEQKHGGRPLEHESLITLMPKVSDHMLTTCTLTDCNCCCTPVCAYGIIPDIIAGVKMHTASSQG